MRTFLLLGLGLLVSCDDASLFGRYRVADDTCTRQSAAGGPPCVVPPIGEPSITGPTRVLSSGRYPVRYEVKGLAIRADADPSLRPLIRFGATEVTDFQVSPNSSGGVFLSFSLPPEAGIVPPPPEGRMAKLLVTDSAGRSASLDCLYFASVVRLGGQVSVAGQGVKSVHIGALNDDGFDDIILCFGNKLAGTDVIAFYGDGQGNLRQQQGEYLGTPYTIAGSGLAGVVFGDLNQGRPSVLMAVNVGKKIYHRSFPMISHAAVLPPEELVAFVPMSFVGNPELVALAATSASPSNYFSVKWRAASASPEIGMPQQATIGGQQISVQRAFSLPGSFVTPPVVVIGTNPQLRAGVAQVQTDATVRLLASQPIDDLSGWTPAIGDVTGDMNPDLVFAYPRSPLAVLSGAGDGAGGFTLSRSSLPVQPGSVNNGAVILPLDADAIQDLAVSTTDGGNGRVEMYRLGFAALPPVSTHLLPGATVIAMAVGDMNNDKFPDLVVAWTAPGNVGTEVSVTTLLNNQIQ